MAVSVSGLRGTSSVSTRAMNYTVSNQSQFSDSYTDSIKNLSANAVDAASPVVYANSQATRTMSVNPMEAAQETQRVSKAMNDIAEGFSGANTGYSQNMAAQKYDTVGSNIDLYI